MKVPQASTEGVNVEIKWTGRNIYSKIAGLTTVT